MHNLRESVFKSLDVTSLPRTETECVLARRQIVANADINVIHGDYVFFYNEFSHFSRILLS